MPFSQTAEPGAAEKNMREMCAFSNTKQIAKKVLYARDAIPRAAGGIYGASILLYNSDGKCAPKFLRRWFAAKPSREPRMCNMRGDAIPRACKWNLWRLYSAIQPGWYQSGDGGDMPRACGSYLWRLYSAIEPRLIESPLHLRAWPIEPPKSISKAHGWESI